LHALEWALDQDVPSPEPPTPLSFETYVQSRLNNPDLVPDGWFVAVHDDAYVGLSNLWKSQAGPDLFTGLTGVVREYRRQGIALALKLRAIDYARSQGVKVVRTWNESRNRPMLGLNERLGFKRQAAWIDYVKVLRQE
jgi:GNAT superfamily N-acetyltransferase